MRGTVRFRVIRLPRMGWWWALLAVLLGLAVSDGLDRPLAALPVAVPTTSRPVMRDQPIYTVPVKEKLISFAVNVDWGGELLPRMLELFEKHGARVTFFPTGRWASMEPELVREIVRAGHELGNHGYRHDHPKALGDDALRDHIVSNQRLLQQLTGVTTTLYAPPYGEVDARIASVSAATGHWTIMWTIDTIDWQRPNPDVIVRRVVPKVQPGAIVLMHPTEPTLAALPTMLVALQADGWTVVPVGVLLERALAAQAASTGPTSR